MYDLGCMLVESRPFEVLDGLPGLYGIKYNNATTCGLPLYLCSYKLVGSAIEGVGGGVVVEGEENGVSQQARCVRVEKRVLGVLITVAALRFNVK